MQILITGAAGFIGFHLSKALLEKGYTIIGIDNLNDYYDVQLKKNRLSILNKRDNFIFHKIDLKDKESIDNIFKEHSSGHVINLAAQVGARHSIESPMPMWIQTFSFMNILRSAGITRLNTYFMLLHLQYTEEIRACLFQPTIM